MLPLKSVVTDEKRLVAQQQEQHRAVHTRPSMADDKIGGPWQEHRMLVFLAYLYEALNESVTCTIFTDSGWIEEHADFAEKTFFFDVSARVNETSTILLRENCCYNAIAVAWELQQECMR